MLKFITQLFNYNEKELSRLKKKVDEINALEDKTRDLKDDDFKKETQKLQTQVQSGEKTLDEVLPWAFALVREAARRSIGLRHFDVQLMAGIALHEKKIAEQKTGEGKTLTATAALYLNALTGKGVHLVTVNDYLVRRDAGWMGKVFDFLGLSTAAIISDASFIYDPHYKDSQAQDERIAHLRPVSRKEAYLADVTYGINSEFGFDYLRDNMAAREEYMVQRGFYYAIIDEADSVLIDEARTPHIISAPFEEDTSKYYQYAQIVKQLKPEADYVIDEKLRTANLTEAGIHKIESSLGVDNIYEKDFDTLFHIEAALKAETLFKNDKDYIVKDGEVIIVDEFTGRLLQGRRFSEGLHQAIEAKERVTIQKESKTLATVSLQNYFRMYEKLAGMTGTAATESEEFHKIYKSDVLVLPTNRSMVRKDHPDMIYKTEEAKFNAVVDEIASSYKVGRPVLVGTTSIEKNERLSKLLNKRGIPHELLNAKNHEREAQIIARAGEKGAVTIATNMAGRGVDIILGGVPSNDENMTQEKKKKEEEKLNIQHDEVAAVGGLYVIGTERHESRRIDNQLRGRAGRQGDPGETRFFVSLEDDLMRIFGGEQISNLMSFLKFPPDQPLSHPMVSKAIEQAQVKVEGFNFDTRKHLVEFDDVLNKQREIVYSLRKKLVTLPEHDADEFRETVYELFEEEIAGIFATYMSMGDTITEEELEVLAKDLDLLVPNQQPKIQSYLKKRDLEGLQEYITKTIYAQFKEREEKLSQLIWFDVVRSIFLSTIDQYWTQHLTSIEDLREGINLRGYAQLDPLVEYKNEAYKMFEKLISNINFDFTRKLFRVEVNIQPAQFEETTHEEVKDKKPEQKKVTKNAKKTYEEPKKEQKMILHSASATNPFTAQQHLANAQSQDMAGDTLQTEPMQNQQFMPDLGIKVIPPGTQKRKLGRNDLCWCGSGKKYKKCHLNSDMA